MKKTIVLLIILAVCIICGCKYDSRGERIKGQAHNFATSLVNNSDEDNAIRIKVLKDNGFYYYNTDVKKCYWVVLIIHGVSFDAVDCSVVSHLLINKTEYPRPVEKY